MNFFGIGRRGFVLALLALIVSAGASPRALAVVDNVVYNPSTGHWYKYVPGTVNWAQSKSGAIAIGGYLASMNDLAECTWTIANLSPNATGVWIGGSDNGSEGSWYWANGDLWIQSNANWNTGEPNNSGTEDYMMMYTSGTTSGKWNDAPTNYTLPGYFVEWNSDPNPPPPPVAPSAPTGLTATLSFQSTIQLAWTDTSDNEASFEVQRMPAGGAFGFLATLGANTKALEDTDLVPTTVYTYRVRAVNSVAPSAWSNEATATSGAYAPTTPAPSDLLIVDVTAGTADLQWVDKSNGENGFEIHRKKGNGTLAFLFKTAADVVTFHDSGLSPDTDYGYAVRSVGTLRASGFIEGSTRTDPTLTVATTKGDLKDSPKFGKDSLKATATWALLDGISDGTADPVAEGITVRAGGVGAPVVLAIAPGDPLWKGKGAKWKWKNPSGSASKFQIQVDLDKHLVTVSAVNIELTAAPVNPVAFSLAIGDDAGTQAREWAPQKKPGFLKLR